MLYHIDNTPEIPSDRFGTGGKQQFTDPVDPTDIESNLYNLQLEMGVLPSKQSDGEKT